MLPNKDRGLLALKIILN